MDHSQDIVKYGDNSNSQNTNNYIQIIPVDYTRRPYPQNDYQYNDCRSHDEYYSIQNQKIQAEVNAHLYSVSQRLPTVPSYSPINRQGDWDKLTDKQKGIQNDGKESNSSDSLEKSVMGSNHSSCSNQTATSSIVAGSSSGGSTASAVSPPLPSSSNITSTSTTPPPTNICIYTFSRLCINLEISGDEDPFQVVSSRILATVLDEIQITARATAGDVFSLWMVSPLLELQLDSHHCPYKINSTWQRLLSRYSSAPRHKKEKDVPILRLQRNLYYPKHLEEAVKDVRINELLYEEARHNVIMGKLPLESSQAILLGGLQARIMLGAFDAHRHTDRYFRENQDKFLPKHARSGWWFRSLWAGRKSSVEAKLMEQMQRAPPSAPPRKLRLKYLTFCRAQPTYGAAFFQGQIEQPVRSLTSLLMQEDIPVLVAITSAGVYVIDDCESTMLLSLLYEEMSWELGLPSDETNEDLFPCIFLQFMVVENGMRVSKILQVFSKQAQLMDNLIEHFAREFRRRVAEEHGHPHHYDYHSDGLPLSLPPLWRPGSPNGRLATKLSRLTLATHDAHANPLDNTWQYAQDSETPVWHIPHH